MASLLRLPEQAVVDLVQVVVNVDVDVVVTVVVLEAFIAEYWEKRAPSKKRSSGLPCCLFGDFCPPCLKKGWT